MDRDSFKTVPLFKCNENEYLYIWLLYRNSISNSEGLSIAALS